MAIVTLKPGYLVSLKTKIVGGPRYTHESMDAEKPEGDVVVEKFITTKVTEDPAEFERATKVRGKCRSLIAGTCIPSEFGLLCTVGRKGSLDEAIKEASALAERFNADAKTCHVSFYVLTGKIAESEGEAAKAIASEVRELLDEMKDGIAEASPDRIRAAASQAKKLGMLLDASAAEKVSAAIEEARSAARAIVRRVEADGESAAIVVQELSRKALEEARFAFLDLDEPIPGSATGGGSAAPAREVDTDEGGPVAASAYAAPSLEV